MNIPDDLRYSNEHEWLRLDGDDATIGITDYAQDQLGDIVYLDLPAIDATLTQFDKLGEIESVKAVSDLYAPAGGQVTEINQAAIDEPELVNNDPYGRGWLVRLRLSDPAQLDTLLSPQAYRELIASQEE